MATHPLWRPYDVPDLDTIGSAFVGGAVPRETVEVVAPDPSWPAVAADWIARLSPVLEAVEHVGSTAVPGLWAKPMIDLDAVRDDPDDETAYLPGLEAIGFRLRVREPDFDGHRMLVTGADVRVNLHVWDAMSTEPARHVAFRNWLRTHPDDRAAYADVKREVAAQGHETVMAYNNAKSGLIYDLYERIFADDPDHPHDPRPRPS